MTTYGLAAYNFHDFTADHFKEDAARSFTMPTFVSDTQLIGLFPDRYAFYQHLLNAISSNPQVVHQLLGMETRSLKTLEDVNANIRRITQGVKYMERHVDEMPQAGGGDKIEIDFQLPPDVNRETTTETLKTMVAGIPLLADVLTVDVTQLTEEEQTEYRKEMQKQVEKWKSSVDELKKTVTNEQLTDLQTSLERFLNVDAPAAAPGTPSSATSKFTGAVKAYKEIVDKITNYNDAVRTAASASSPPLERRVSAAAPAPQPSPEQALQEFSRALQVARLKHSFAQLQTGDASSAPQGGDALAKFSQALQVARLKHSLAGLAKSAATPPAPSTPGGDLLPAFSRELQVARLRNAFQKLAGMGGGSIQEGGVDPVEAPPAAKEPSYFATLLSQWNNASGDKKAQAGLVEDYESHPLLGLEAQNITVTDRIVFIAVTFFFRGLCIYLVEWGIDTQMIRDFQSAFLSYMILYIGLFFLWVLLVNAPSENNIFRMLFYYISTDPHRYGRIFAHVVIFLLLIPIPFVVKETSNVAGDEFTFEKKRALFQFISQFTFFIWMITSLIATRY